MLSLAKLIPFMLLPSPALEIIEMIFFSTHFLLSFLSKFLVSVLHNIGVCFNLLESFLKYLNNH